MIGTEGDSFQLPEGSSDNSLSKPIPAKSLRLSVTHVIELLTAKKYDKNAGENFHSTRNHRLVVSEKRSIIFIQISDILYFQSDGNYTKIIFTNGNCHSETVLASKNLLHFETRVISHDFVRIHQSILVNFAKISRIERNSNEAILIDGTILPIARDHKKDTLLKLLR